MTEPTYDQLRAERAREWAEAQTKVAKAHARRQAKLQKMPDIQPPESPWDTAGTVICACGAHVFRVEHWTSVNGVRHRAELRCEACQKIGTWDFGMKRWL